jgi:GTPase SAR1 family protein
VLFPHNIISITQEASEYATENGIIYMETSAKAGQNVKELFESIATKLPKTQSADDDTARFPILPAQDEKKNPCC